MIEPIFSQVAREVAKNQSLRRIFAENFVRVVASTIGKFVADESCKGVVKMCKRQKDGKRRMLRKESRSGKRTRQMLKK